MPVMEEHSTGDIVIGVVTVLGVLVLIVVFVYVVKQVFSKKGE
ncbi:protein of unknown function [Nitrospira japonica]|uniref:Uncharacterized protein n=1 Tax=Nitrospira japonica TaxID=1325564 RepID=A0A1W1IAJ4_9BACT|nr:protein of unknown function [Nitrospira japonica]